MRNLKLGVIHLAVYRFICLACAATALAEQELRWSRQKRTAAPQPGLSEVPAATRQLISSSAFHSPSLGPCGESVVLSRGESFHFTSPGFPSLYPGFSRCYWVFQSRDPSSALSLQCSEFQLTPVELCNKFQDFLLVEEQGTGRAHWFCGGIGPRNLLSPSMWVTFWSDEYDSRRGFSCHVAAAGGAAGAGGAGDTLGGVTGQDGGGLAGVAGAGPGSASVLTGLTGADDTSFAGRRCNCGVRNTPSRAPSFQATRGRPRFPRQDKVAKHEGLTDSKHSENLDFDFETDVDHTKGNLSQFNLPESTTFSSGYFSSDKSSSLQPKPSSSQSQELESEDPSTTPLTTHEPTSNDSFSDNFVHTSRDPETRDDLDSLQVATNVTAGEHGSLNQLQGHLRNSRKNFPVPPSTKIVNGSPVAPHEFPWLVLLEYPHLAGVHCAGSLISSRYVLTAAHCTQYFNGLLTVILGEHDRSTTSDTPHTRRVAARRVIPHPLFNSTTNDNDIAIIMLDSELRLDQVGPYISPICPPNPDDLYEKEITYVVGWGTTSERDQRGSNLPLTAVVQTVGHRQCQELLAETAVTPNMLCARGRGTDTCQNDSGGPLMARYKGSRYVLAGIVSWGIGCARPLYPGVYTRVGNYLQWIKDNTKGSKTCPPIKQ